MHGGHYQVRQGSANAARCGTLTPQTVATERTTAIRPAKGSEDLVDELNSQVEVRESGALLRMQTRTFAPESRRTSIAASTSCQPSGSSTYLALWSESVSYPIKRLLGTAACIFRDAISPDTTNQAVLFRSMAERVRTARGVLDVLWADHGFGGQPPDVERLLDAREAASTGAATRPPGAVQAPDFAVGVGR